jgi:acyl-coenzyme A synthetase/AMP-(fatty) acid ligase
MILDAIFAAAAASPGKDAVIFNGRAWSFGAFAAAIEAGADHLVGRGVGGHGVGILAVDDILDAWIWGFALRRLGLTTVIARSVDEIAALDLTDVRCLLVPAANPRPDLASLCARQDWPLIAMERQMTLSARPRGDAPARPPGGHILQTSGTTGAAKKVLIDPSQEALLVARRQTVYGIGRDTVAAYPEFGGWTGVGYKSAVAVWAVGGTVVIDQGRAAHLALAEPRLTHTELIPIMLASILAAPADAIAFNPGLQMVVTGAPITEALAREARSRVTPRLLTAIGATEVSVFACTPLTSSEDRRWHRPVADAEVQIVDEDDRPLSPGGLGRLRVSAADGPGAYLGDPAASAEFFRHGFFYPGDLAVMRQDGRFALHGRVTDVVNILGQKLAPAPIEDALREALGVTGVCLFSMQDDNAEEQAHLAIETDTPVDQGVLAGVLGRYLPGLASAHVHHVRALPRNSMGKVQRLALQVLLRGAAR